MSTTRAFSYRRFSTPEQAAGDSLRRQIAMAESYCAQHKLTLDTGTDLTDAGISAYAAKNLETDAKLGAFLKLIESGDVPPGSVLLIENLDRMSRQPPRKALRVLEDIIERGVEVVTLSDGVRWTLEKLDGPELFAAIAVMMRAHDESKQKSRRVKAAISAKVERAAATGALFSRMVPAWVDVAADGKRTLNDRKKVVRRIFEAYAGGMGKAAVCHSLNADKVPSFGRGKLAGRGWSKPYVSNVLTDGTAIGTLTAGGKALENYYPGAVDKALWVRVQERHAAARGQRSQPTTLPVLNVLAGLGRCPHCGSIMTRLAPGKQFPGRRAFLICSKARAQGAEQCPQGAKARIALPDIESALRALVDLPVPSATGGLDDLVAAARDRVATLEDHISALVGQLEHRASPALSKRLAEREAALPVAQADLAALEAQYAVSNKRSVAKNYAALVAALKAKAWNAGAVNAALSVMLSKVVVDHSRQTLELFWKHDSSTKISYADEPRRERPTAAREFVDLS